MRRGDKADQSGGSEAGGEKCKVSLCRWYESQRLQDLDIEIFETFSTQRSGRFGLGDRKSVV